MATLVLTDNLKIFIDPYAALAPKRYGLPPTNLEIEMLKFYLEKIYEIGNFCNYVIITHYHYDHHPKPYDNKFFENFKNCKFLIKSFEKEHYSAKKRGSIFIKKLNEYKIDFEFIDGKEIKIGNVKIIFSKPVWHGEINSKVGKVIMVLIKHKKRKFFFGSDAQFLIDDNALSFVLENSPDILIIDGFPTILENYKIKKESFEIGIKHMKKIIEETNYELIIIDHHLLRDKDFFKKFPYFNEKILTAAKFYKMENLMLEAYRKEIYENKICFKIENYKRKIEEIVSKIKI